MAEARRERFEAIFADEFDHVLRFALARCDAETAKDIAAETFATAWRSLDVVPAQPRAWLFSVARRRAIDHYRATGRRAELQASLEVQVTLQPDPAEDVTAHDRVRAAFARMNTNDQELLRLLAWDGLSRSEAAQVLGCSAATFAVRLHRARRRLRAALDDQEPAGQAPDLITQEASP